jgi:hypothetical protein
MHSVYKDFLTDKELEEVIMGKEMWFDSEEIVRRLELRAQLQEKREKAQEKAVAAEVKKSKTKN